MAEDRVQVGVLIARRELKGPWADHAWLPYAVLPAAPLSALLQLGSRLVPVYQFDSPK